MVNLILIIDYVCYISKCQYDLKFLFTLKVNYPGSRTYVPSIHELSTRTVTMTRDPPDGTHGFGICVKGGKDSGK